MAVRASDPEAVAHWKQVRQLARTNLSFLCRQVLGYRDVVPHVHADVVNNLQRFYGGRDEGDCIRLDGKQYKPMYSWLWDLGGPPELPEGYPNTWKQTLNLIPRGHLKSTICTIAHTIQWLINYPLVRVHIVSCTLDNAQMFLTEIRGHFTNNENFRYYFPEFCPPEGKTASFGNMDKFTIPNRPKELKEPSVSVSSIEKPLSGPHFEVLKCDDVVNAGNCRTKEQIEQIKYNFSLLNPLIETCAHRSGPTKGWLDVIGTRYDFADLYGAIIEDEEKKMVPDEWDAFSKLEGAERKTRERELVAKDRKLERKTWSIVVKSAAPNWPEGPALWPERVGMQQLKDIYNDPSLGPSVLSSQYLMNPVPVGTGLIDSRDDIWWVPRRVIDQIYPGLALYTAVDLAGMEQTKGNDNDFTAVTTGGFGRDGRLYIIETFHGKPQPKEVMEYLFDLYKRRPRITHIKVEKENHARVLLPWLKQEQEKRGVWLPILAIPRDNQQSKVQKLKGLEPWLKSKRIGFAEDLPNKDWIINEILRFPKWKDDSLDTFRDLMDDGEGGVTADVIARPKVYDQRKEPTASKFLGFAPGGQEAWEDAVAPGWGGDPMTGL